MRYKEFDPKTDSLCHTSTLRFSKQRAIHGEYKLLNTSRLLATKALALCNYFMAPAVAMATPSRIRGGPESRTNFLRVLGHREDSAATRDRKAYSGANLAA